MNVLDEWMKKQKTLLSLWKGEKNKRRLVCFLLDRTLWAVDWKEGKILSARRTELDGDATEETLGQAFIRLRDMGVTGKKVTLLVNFPALRLENKKYPLMTEEEVEETMYWEEDRLFHTNEPLSMGYAVLQKNDRGWEIHMEAVKKEEISLWERATGRSGKRIEEAVPVTAVPLTEEPHFTLYARRKSAILIFRGEGVLRSRILKAEDEGKGAFFMGKTMNDFRLDSTCCFFVPMGDCSEERGAAWKEWLSHEIKGEEGAEEGLMPGAVTLAEEGFQREMTPFREYLPVLAYLDDRILTLPAGAKKVPFFTAENRNLRLAEGACLLGLAFCLFSGGSFLTRSMHLASVQKEAEILRPHKERMLSARREQGKEEELKGLLEKLEKTDPHWEKKLILLAEAMPSGVVISEIRGEGNAVEIRGTAVSPESLRLFRRNVDAFWGGQGELTQKQNGGAGLWNFIIRWKEGKGKSYGAGKTG